MKPVAIFALIAAWFTIGTATPSQYRDFPPDAEHQARLDYIHSLEMIKVEAGDELQQAMGIQMPELPVGATPFDLFKAMHRFGLNVKRNESHLNRRDYFFGNASFFDSAYRVFELQGDYYESYGDYATTHGLLPMRYTEWSPELRGDIEEGLKLGGQWVAAEFMFIAEEPAEFTNAESPVRHPFFVRLVWIPGQDMWRLVEAFAPNDAPVLFLFNAT